MTALLVLGLLFLMASMATLVAARHDRPRKPPRSHHIDPAFLPPAQRL